jgi:hypothetical protein
VVCSPEEELTLASVDMAAMDGVAEYFTFSLRALRSFAPNCVGR